MAYFSNGSEGSVLDTQCAKCKYGQEPCPIFFLQINYNYEACNNKLARTILDFLIAQDGTCKMWETFRNDFEINPNQLTMEL